MILLPLLCLLLATPLGAASAVISTFAGNGSKGFSGDGGPAIQAQLNDPTGIARGPDGALYICDTGNHRIRRVTPDGRIATVAGAGQRGWTGDGGPATAAQLNEPYEVRFDAAGHVFWVERLSHTVRRLDSKTGIITTIAGNGTAGFSGDNGPANRAQLSDPHSIGFDKKGDLFICDVKNHRVRRVDMKTGKIFTFAGTGEKKAPAASAPLASAPLFGPRALDFDSAGRLWLALREGNAILKLDRDRSTVDLAAGSGKRGFAGDDGPAPAASLSGPKGLSVAPNGDVYLADTENHCVRMIDAKSGTMRLVAGTGMRGDGSETDPLHCKLARPHGIFVERDGTIFIGDSENHRVRIIRKSP
jgi:streptogramin lyase